MPPRTPIVGGVDVEVPALARGGIVHRPTLALIGEGGPEGRGPRSPAPRAAPAACSTSACCHRDLQALREDLAAALDPHRTARAWRDAQAFTVPS